MREGVGCMSRERGREEVSWNERQKYIREGREGERNSREEREGGRERWRGRGGARALRDGVGIIIQIFLKSDSEK